MPRNGLCYGRRMDRINVSVFTNDEGSMDGVDGLALLLKAQVPGAITGASGRPGASDFTVEVDRGVVDQRLRQSHPARCPMLFGCTLYTDNDRLSKMCSPSSPVTSEETWNREFPGLMAAASEAIKRLSERDLKAEEIFVLEGKVRVMTSKHFGRRDSGWVAIDPSAVA